MFCPLFRLYDSTKLDFHEFEHCGESCKSRTPVFNPNHICTITEKRHDKLTSEKFGWMIDTVIKFSSPVAAKNVKTIYTGFISLAHPSEKDIWVGRFLNKKKEVKYTLFNVEKKYDFDDLKALNFWLKKQNFNGREIVDSDFVLKEK